MNEYIVTSEVKIVLFGEDELDAKKEFEQAEFFNQNGFMDENNVGRSQIQLDNFVDELNEGGRIFIKMIWDSLKGWEEYNK